MHCIQQISLKKQIQTKHATADSENQMATNNTAGTENVQHPKSLPN